MFIEECRAKTNSAFAYADDVINNIRENLKDDRESDEKPKSFMRALMNPKNNLCDEEIRDEIKTLLIAVKKSKN